ncbi:MAG: DMT family protein, partial [Planctomycetota bacterium]
MLTIALLILSNVFMTFAWYWHLKGQGPAWPLWMIIGASWLIALPEYCLAVPANRFGSLTHGGAFTAAQLKVIQEGVS